MIIKIKRLHKDAYLPTYATSGSAGMDLYCLEACMLEPGQVAQINLGFAVEIPEGHEMQIRSRSSKAKAGIIVMNQPGTVDSDYRGEVGVLLFNISPNHVVLPKGERIAQAIITTYNKVEWDEYDELTETIRGEGGFGSTDIDEEMDRNLEQY